MFQAAEITANTPNGKDKKYAAQVLTMPKKNKIAQKDKIHARKKKRRGGE